VTGEREGGLTGCHLSEVAGLVDQGRADAEGTLVEVGGLGYVGDVDDCVSELHGGLAFLIVAGEVAA
jgi:hypothetical protein